MQTPTPTTRWSTENIINLIRRLRNDLINDFLDDRFLKNYLRSEFNLHDVPAEKSEHIKSDLKELLITPVNVTHYESLIRIIKETDTASLSKGNEELFYQEIDALLKRSLC